MRRLLVACCLLGCAGPDDPDRRVRFDPADFDPRWTAVRADAPETWNAAWSAGDGTTWIVGGDDEGRGRAVVAEEGAIVPLQLPDEARTLRAVHGTSARDVWLGGDAGTLLRLRGRALRTVDPGTRAPILAVAAAARDDVLVVGGSGEAMARRFDGDAWRPVELPPLPRGTVLVAARVDGDGWLVIGSGGVTIRLGPDGAERLPDVDAPLRAVAGRVAVGGISDGWLWALEGGAWTPQARALAVLRGVAAVGGGRFVAVGDRGTTTVWDGETLADSDPFTLATLRAVTVTADGAAWAAGDGVIGWSPPP